MSGTVSTAAFALCAATVGLAGGSGTTAVAAAALLYRAISCWVVITIGWVIDARLRRPATLYADPVAT